MTYKSQLHTLSFEQLLKQNLEKDKVLQYTSVGIHKDDLSFEIEDYPIKKFAALLRNIPEKIDVFRSEGKSHEGENIF